MEGVVDEDVQNLVSKEEITTIESTEFYKRLLEFLTLVDGLTISLFAVIPEIESKIKETKIELGDYLKKHCEVVTRDEETTTWQVHAANMSQLQSLKSTIESLEIGRSAIPSNFLVALISNFDTYLMNVSKMLLFRRPEKLDTKENRLTYRELFIYSSIEEARDNLTSLVIENVFRGSHSDQIEWICKTFDVDVRKHMYDCDGFIEVTERRNIIVHNGSMISAQYIKNCSGLKTKFMPEMKADEKLHVDYEYFIYTLEMLIDNAIRITHLLWRKQIPDEIIIADSSIAMIAFKLIEQGRYELAIRLLRFSLEILLKNAEEGIIRRCLLNLAQAYKWKGDEQECNRVIKSADWSDSSSTSLLAVAVLQNNFETAYDLMKKIGSQDKYISQAAYLTWPIFKEVRKEDGFRETYKEIFNDEYTIQNDDIDQFRDEHNGQPPKINAKQRQKYSKNKRKSVSRKRNR